MHPLREYGVYVFLLTLFSPCCSQSDKPYAITPSRHVKRGAGASCPCWREFEGGFASFKKIKEIHQNMPSVPTFSPYLRQIKASAGSGKTYDLTRRFLAHLSQSAPGVHVPSCGLGGAGGSGSWGDILAVTFTNSAAAEMQERVIRQLKEIALGKGGPDGVRISPRQAALWVDSILRQLSALNIRTIDSFLHLVVRMSALDLDLPPDFTPTFSTEESLTPLLDASIEQAWQGDRAMQDLLRGVCEGLLYHSDIKGFMVGKRITRRVMELMDAALTGDWSKVAGAPELAARSAGYAQLYRERAGHLQRTVQAEGLKVHASALKAFARAEQGDVKAATSAYFSKEGLDGCLLKASQGLASAVAERAYGDLQAAAEAVSGTGQVLRRALELAPFVALTQKVAQGLEAFQQAEGTIAGVRIPYLAQKALSEGQGVSGALCRMGTRLTHLMLDEFQDTSRVQWQALLPLVQDALARGGSLTWVGDVKQAIYGWRGGDASLFDELLEADAGLQTTQPQVFRDTLPTNWRSREEIVRFNNGLFDLLANPAHAVDVLLAMLPRQSPPAQVGEAAALMQASFAACGQIVPARAASKGGCVRVEAVDGESSAHLDELVRQRLCRLMQEDIGPRRPWSDVTILVRSNPAASKVAAWLMDLHIPVVTENSLLLAEHPLIVQTVAFLSFLDTPQDDLAFWTFVSGSIFCGMSGLEGQDLHNWAAEREKGQLFKAFRLEFSAVWAQWLAPFDTTAGLMTPYDTVQEFFVRFRVLERFGSAQTFLRRFLEVVYRAESNGRATLGTFLEHWRDKGAEEKLPMPENMDAVRIMTIHKSKGLQFKVVVMPWTSFTPRPDSPPVQLELDGLELLAPRCKEMGPLYYEAMADMARESLHLLYVAFTRAVDELHVFHTRTPALLNLPGLAPALEVLWTLADISLPLRKGKAISTKAAPVQKSLFDMHGSSVLSDVAQMQIESDIAVPVIAVEPDIAVAPDLWRPMQWLPQLKIFRNPLQSMVFNARQRGILAHSCLEYFQWTGQPQGDVHRAVERGMRLFPLALQDKDALAADIRAILLWYVSLPDAPRWLQEGVPEQSIMDAQGSLHRVDLLVTQAQARIAVDYKTGSPSPKDVLQMQRYLELLTALDSTSPVHAVLVYLDIQQCRTVTRGNVSALANAPVALADMGGTNHGA